MISEYSAFMGIVLAIIFVVIYVAARYGLEGLVVSFWCVVIFCICAVVFHYVIRPAIQETVFMQEVDRYSLLFQNTLMEGEWVHNERHMFEKVK